jgi:hypothetical protein
MMHMTMLSPLGQALLSIAGAAYAVWRFWIGREHRARFRTSLDCTSTAIEGTTVLDAVYTISNVSKRMFEIRSVKVSAREAVVDPESGRLNEGKLLITDCGHVTQRLVHPRAEGLVGISPLLPDESAGFSLRVLVDNLPPYIFIVGEVEIEGVHTPGKPGRYVKMHCASPAGSPKPTHVAHARGRRREAVKPSAVTPVRVDGGGRHDLAGRRNKRGWVASASALTLASYPDDDDVADVS